MIIFLFNVCNKISFQCCLCVSPFRFEILFFFFSSFVFVFVLISWLICWFLFISFVAIKIFVFVFVSSQNHHRNVNFNKRSRKIITIQFSVDAKMVHLKSVEKNKKKKSKCVNKIHRKNNLKAEVYVNISFFRLWILIDHFFCFLVVSAFLCRL